MSIDLLGPEESEGLSDFDRERVWDAWLNAFSGETYRVYGIQWRGFVQWCDDKGVKALPASPAVVGAYLAKRADSGASWSSLGTMNAAIRKYHEDEGFESPTLDRRLRRLRKGIRNEINVAPKQVEGLTRDVFILIAAAGWEPRPGESPERALLRAVTDIALIALMRDCMLRRSEVARAKWQDLESRPGGRGALHIVKSKTRRSGGSVLKYVSLDTMVYLFRMLDVRGGREPRLVDPIFGIGEKQVCNRIQKAAEGANLLGRYRGHSPKIGMAHDLAEKNFEMPSLMQAGGWRSGGTVYRYIERMRAAKSAVAVYYEMVGDGVLDPNGPVGMLEVA